MSAQRIAFDSQQYEQLISQLTSLIDSLEQVTTSGSMPLSENVRLQPEGQTWTPALNLVNAGSAFFGRKTASVEDGRLPQLINLRDGLIQARSIFQDAEDLESISRADFTQQFPDLIVPTPNRLNDPW